MFNCCDTLSWAYSESNITAQVWKKSLQERLNAALHLENHSLVSLFYFKSNAPSDKN